MLVLLSEQAFMPIRYLFVLHIDPVIDFKFVDYLVCFVLFLVRELLILSLDKLDRLISVVRTFDPSEKLSLQLFESFTFFNRYVKLFSF